MPDFLIVDWVNENTSDVLSANKVIAPNGVALGETVHVKQGQECWTGKISSIHGSKNKAEQRYHELYPQQHSSTPTTVANGKRERKKKDFKDFEDIDLAMTSSAKKPKHKDHEQGARNITEENEKLCTDENNLEKEKAKTDKGKAKMEKEKAKVEREKAKVEKEKAKVEKEKAKVEKEKAKVEKEKEKAEKEREKHEREEKKREEEEVMKNKENVFLEQFNQSDKSIDFETELSPFKSTIEQNDHEFSDSESGQDSFIADVREICRNSPTVNDHVDAFESPVRKKKHPSKGGKAPRSHFPNAETSLKSPRTPVRDQSKAARSRPSPKLVPKSPRKPLSATKPKPYRYAVNKVCSGCTEKIKIINDQTNRVQSLESENNRLQNIIDRGCYVDDSAPKSGKLAPKVAEKYMMTKLHPECPNVYLTQFDFSLLMTKTTPSKSALFLIDCFYEKEEQFNMTVNGSAKANKAAVDPVLKKAILHYCREKFKGTSYAVSDAALNAALRSKFTSLRARGNDEEGDSAKKMLFPNGQ
ncbi:caldesmon-like [Clytia hemisphaerica]